MGRRFTPEYPPEFRAEAVPLVREGGRNISAAAKDLGVSAESLRNWVKQDALDSGLRKDGLTTDERKELVRLRRENRDLREDREILKSRRFLRQGTQPDPVAVFDSCGERRPITTCGGRVGCWARRRAATTPPAVAQYVRARKKTRACANSS